MNTKLVATTARVGARHPRATLRSGAFVARHWRGSWKAFRSGRAVVSSAQELAAGASDPAVRESVGAAARSFGAAIARSRQLGPRKAAEDKRVARHVSDGIRHASKAARLWRPAKPRRRVGRLLGVSGLVAIAGVAAWEGKKLIASVDV